MDNIIPKIVDKIYEEILIYLADKTDYDASFIFYSDRDFQDFLLDKLLEVYNNKNKNE